MCKNILIITDYAAPYEGNFIMSLKSLQREVEKSKGKIFYLFTKKAMKIEWLKNLNNVYYLDDSFKSNIEIIKKIINTENINVMYTHFCLPKTQLAAKIVRKFNKKVKLVSHFHNHYVDPKNILKKHLFRFAFDGDINIGCSKDVADSLPFKKKKKTYVTNAIDFSRLDNFEKIKLTDSGKFVVLMFGYTYYRKGVDLAIKAIEKIDNDNILLAISISKNENEFREQIIHDFGKIPEFVKIIKPRNDIATYYKASNLFLSAAREEGFCYAIIESMYCGIPCICTELPGQPNEIPDLIKVESKNVKQLAEEIEKIYDNEYNFDKKKVRKYLVENYSVEIWSNSVKEIILDNNNE